MYLQEVILMCKSGNYSCIIKGPQVFVIDINTNTLYTQSGHVVIPSIEDVLSNEWELGQ